MTRITWTTDTPLPVTVVITVDGRGAILGARAWVAGLETRPRVAHALAAIIQRRAP